MTCRYSTKTFSDLASSHARVSNSIINLERRIKITSPLKSELSAATESAVKPEWLLPSCLSVLWGVGLFGVLEVEILPVKLCLISLLLLASFGLDSLFGSHQ